VDATVLALLALLASTPLSVFRPLGVFPRRLALMFLMIFNKRDDDVKALLGVAGMEVPNVMNSSWHSRNPRILAKRWPNASPTETAV
jgi:hypothetical protein